MIKMTSAIFVGKNHEATSDGHGNTLNDVYFLSMVVFTKFDTCFEV